MVFSSVIFLFVFLPITLFLYYISPKKIKNSFLLFASLTFYAFGEPKFVFVMMISIVANYILGLIINFVKDKSKHIKHLVLFLSTAINISFLFYYKYFDFFIENVNTIFNLDIPLKNIVLPIGISFFTFQGMSYLFDLYKGKVPVQKSLINIALYISLFPQLIAGPIVRYESVSEQILKRNHSFEKFNQGTKRFATGLFKKVIFSNQFAVLADFIFNDEINERSIAFAWAGAIAYTLQIYFDFSGYSDMAIGLGKMFGFEFLENFNFPYISKNLTDFWRRWHISLSSWFRDYLYIPLGGNRKGNVYVNLLIVFFITGLWHGASWNFIFWGLWHGLFLIIERIIKNKNIKFNTPKFIGWTYTMIIVIIGWVMFRTVDFSQTIFYLKDMIGLNSNELLRVKDLIYLEDYINLFILSILFCMPTIDILKEKSKDKFNNIIIKIEPLYYSVIIIVGISFVVNGGYNPFIYFNF